MLDPAEDQHGPDEPEQTSPAKATATTKLVSPHIATSVVWLWTSGILRQVVWRPAAERWEHCIFACSLPCPGRMGWHDRFCVGISGDL